MPGPHSQNKRDASSDKTGPLGRKSVVSSDYDQHRAAYAGLHHFEDYPVPTLAYDVPSKNIIFWNAALSRLTGYAAGEFSTVTGFVDALLCYAETREVYKQILNVPLTEGELQRSPVTCAGQDGRNYFAELQIWQPHADGYPDNCRLLHLLSLSSADPMVEYLESYSRELDSKIQENKSELERHKQWLEMALEGSREGLWTIDFRSGSMDFAYTNVLTILGYLPEELKDDEFLLAHVGEALARIGHSLDDLKNAPQIWDKLTHPADLPEVQRRLDAHFAGETPYYECQYRALAKNGEWRWILGHGRVIRRDEQGKPLEAVGTHIDIDQLKSIEASLRQSETLFRTLVENAPIGIVLIGDDGGIIYANPRFNELYGYNHEELKTLDAWWELSCPDAAARKTFIAALQNATATGLLSDVHCKDNSTKHALVKLVELPGGRRLVAYEDMTAQIIYERALQKREKELHEKSEKLEEMNAALRVLLNRMNSDREELEHKVFVNIRDMIMPYVDKLEMISHGEAQQSYLNIIKTNLQNVVSSFNLQLAKQSVNLTPRELQIANMINEGMTNKDISAILYISNSAVEFHRHNIRKKLNIVDKKINLKTHLRNIL